MRITRTVEFDAAHRLPLHHGKCRRLHGHTYTVDVTFEGSVLADDATDERVPRSDSGMVVDFKAVDYLLHEVFIDPWDHRTLLHKDDKFVAAIRLAEDAQTGDSVVALDFWPTAERLAEYIGEELNRNMAAKRYGPVVCVRVDVHESPRSIATWELSA